MELARAGKIGNGRLKNGDAATSFGYGFTTIQDPVWTLSQVLMATGGRFVCGRTEAGFRRVCTDTRNLEPGDLFLALTGDKFNGHDFVAEAMRKGAAGLVVSQKPEKEMSVPVILVDDTLTALGDLAAYRRSVMSDLQVLAITGSSGKTTVKEMTAFLLAKEYNVLKTEGNFNNLIGMPLSLLPVGYHHDFAVMEMGMNRPGEIARLTEIAAPDIACITNVQDAHLAGLQDVNGVARAKGELFAGIKAWGTLVVNIDDSRVRALAKRCRQKKITFGKSPKAEVRATRVVSLGERGMSFTLQIGQKSSRVRIKSLGAHNVINSLAAAAMGHAAGLKFTDIVKGLEGFAPFEKRMQVEKLVGGIKLVNDCYNANPSSMLAALETMQHMDHKHKKIVILGDMLELGQHSDAAHGYIGATVGKLKFDYLLTVGAYAEQVVAGALKMGMSPKKAMVFADKKEITAWLTKMIEKDELSEGDWVLVKGSRGMKMETITQGMLAE
ncbi:MAG: UDP-N-acetylmuramoyl-tripeptide--D-alanyl-D-alanine ligase [Desulfobulbaceae bacterium]|nr:UDP-N-acetylmuramoyl-tripeptide--D-alanyl-D-alanine ligase [Desulfobulbaceae bacterium]HIJ79352.1 UDP-N-acetylmuramoyl-tripeptide--D-alanyl-D-alanine ligase [Deltaproteobacteria bacterium]